MNKFHLALAAALALSLTAATKPKTLWTLAEGVDTPESVYVEPASGRIFVSNVVGQAGQKDGKGFVGEIVVKQGKPELKKLVEGLNAPKGLRAKDGVLWTTDIDEVVAIDLKTNQLKEKIKIDGAQFLNDPALGADGTLYVSDMLASRIYQVQGGKVAIFAEGDGLESPNGLLVQEGRLIVAAWGLITDPSTFGAKTPGNVYALDLKTKAKTLLTNAPLGNLDGLEADGEGYVVSDWVNGKVYRLSKAGEAVQIFQSAKNAADIGLSGKTLYVPEMSGNDVVALSL